VTKRASTSKGGADRPALDDTTKREYGQGGITERRNKDGKITGYQCQLRVADGRRSYTAPTEREARRWLREARALAARGELGSSKAPTLTEYLTGSWLQTIAQSVRPRTLASYRLNVSRVPTDLGRRRLDELKPTHLQDFYSALTARGLAPRTVRQAHMTLHKALDDALRLGLVSRNATDGTSLPRMPRDERPWYTDEQLRQLFTATEGDRFHALWVLLGTAGLRLGEALALRWADINTEKRTVSVERSLSRDRSGGGLVFQEPKTPRSRRTAALAREAVHALQAHRERQTFERRKNQACWLDGDLVFCTSLGTPLDQARVHRHWTAATSVAGVPRHHIHDLRHTVASALLAAGRPAERVARMLGHSSVTMLLDVYGHVLPTDYQDEPAAMNALLVSAR